MRQTLALIRLVADYIKGKRAPRNKVEESALDRYEDGRALLQYRHTELERGTIVLLHGVTPRASEDPNLVHLARCVASLGYRCLTPPLTALADFSHDARDVARVVQTLTCARNIAGGPVSVMSFSYGASYALSAAAEPEARDCCRCLLAFGAYHSLADALEHQRQLLARNRHPEFDDSDILYLRYTLLSCHRGELGLPDAAWHDIDGAIRDYMTPGPLAAKKRPLLTHAAHLDYVELMERYQRRELPAILSPAGRLSKVTCPVALLHDPHDRFVPANQLKLIREELDGRPHFTKTRTLETPMLSHVQVNPMVNLRDAWRFIQLLKPTFEA